MYINGGRISKIVWKNIYYMICYCVEELNYFEEADISYEDIKGTHNLLAKLLINTFNKVYSQGYIKKFIKEEIITDKPYGEINIVKSIETGVYGQGKLVCSVDKLDIDNKYNQIIKAAFNLLIMTDGNIDSPIDRRLMLELIRCKSLLNKVSDIELTHETIKISGDIPDYYKPVLVVAKFILDEWLFYDKTDIYRSLELNDKIRLAYIWEKFLRRYIREYMLSDKYSHLEYDVLKTVIDDGYTNREIDLIVKSNKCKNIIVGDAKWYDNEIGSVENVDQIYTYSSRIKEKNKKNNVIGILLYACSNKKTYEAKPVQRHKGNKDAEYLSIKYFINVNQDFDKIKEDINNIVDKYLNYEE